MVKVKVIYIGLLQRSTGTHEEELNLPIGATVKDLLSSLVQKHGEVFKSAILDTDGRLNGILAVLVNDCDIDDIDGLDTKLEDKSETCLMLYDLLLYGG